MQPLSVLDPSLAIKPQEQWRQDLAMRLICKECKEDPPNIVEDFSAGDTVCGSCGLVLGDRIVDTRSEWRTFTNDDQNNDDPSRVGDGANPLLNGAQLQTTIAFAGGAGKARDLSRAQNKAVHDKSTKVLMAAYKEIQAMCDGLNISKNVADVAKHLFKITQDEGVFRGKGQETVIAGCIFIACRQCKVPRTFREVFSITKVSKAEIGRIFKQLEKFFQDHNDKLKAAAMEAGGKQTLQRHSHALYLAKPAFAQAFLSQTARASQTSSRPPPRTSASVTAINSSCLRNAQSCLRRLQRGRKEPVFLRAGHRFLRPQRAFSWPRTWRERCALRKRSRILPASVMARSGMHIRSCMSGRRS